MKRKWFNTLAAAFFGVMTVCACSDDECAVPQTEPTYDMTGFAKGADVSWITEMENNGVKFYDANGTERECLWLMRSLGMNSIRLRVWVDPTDGWNNKQDVLAKAWRAHNLGFRLMIDFHYSDSWADPGQQVIPAAWADYDLEQMKTAVGNHTKDVLQTLKDNGIDVEWVQVGNETRTGMLYELADGTERPIGKATSGNFSNFAQLVSAGYDAVKSVYSDAKVIVHLDCGDNINYYTWMFGGLQSEGAKYDVIGMSLYPSDSDWQDLTSKCLSNITTLSAKYGKEVMVCEVGMERDSEYAEQAITTLVEGCKALDECLGVFYWEPECYNSWNGYSKGAFSDEGKPMPVLNAFK